MTVSTTIAEAIYPCDGVQTVFSAAFSVTAATQVVVLLRNGGTDTLQTRGVHYTLAGVNAAGGFTVTMLTPPAAGRELVIYRQSLQTQDVLLTETGGFNLTGIMNALDRQARLTQELIEQAGRSLKVRVGEPDVTAAFGGSFANRANKALIFSSGGDALGLGPSLTQISDAAANAALASAAAALAVLNGGTAFPSRAAFLASTIPAPIETVSVLHGGRVLNYRSDAGGVAAVTADARTWSPADQKSVLHYGATGLGVADEITAFDLAASDLDIHETLLIPFGFYRLSATWIVKNKYRTKLICEGVLLPHGSFSDFLVHFSNDVGDPLVPSLGQVIRVDGLTLDCEWKCRGVKLEKQYNSSFDHFLILRPFGAGIDCPMVQEVSFYRPQIIAGKARTNAAIAAAGAWNAGVNYTTAGVYVYKQYAAYNAGTAYVPGNVVEAGGFTYRNLIAATGVNPALVANGLTWELIPREYFEATGLAGNLNKDPHGATDFTTRSATAGDRYWKPVYVDEAAWAFIGNGANVTIDNCKVLSPVWRACEHGTLLRVDAAENSFRAAKLEFVAFQLHAITAAYITAFNADAALTAAYGRTIAAPTEGKLVHLVSATGVKFQGGQFQVGDLDRAKGLVCGTLGVSGNAAKTFLTGVQFEGTVGGDAQVGISILPSVETVGANWLQSGVNIAIVGPAGAAKVDPLGETEYEQSGQFFLGAGNTSIAVTFPRPFAAIPLLSLIPKNPMGGLSWQVTGLTNTGFTLTVDGEYTGEPQTANFLSGGPTNQTSAYAHGLIQADDYKLYGASADPGANYRINLSSNNPTTITIVAPAAPANTLNQKWTAVWFNRAPVALFFDWAARVEPDA